MMSNALPVRVDPTASIPLATQLGQQLTWLVVSGRLSEGDELPAVRQLAEQLDINLHTVRAAYRQLAADGLLSVQMGRRARVLSFDRARAGASTADVPSYSIGAIIPEFVSFYAPFLRGIEAAAAEQTAMVFICNAHENESTALGYLDRLVARQVDGIVMSFGTLGPDVTLPPPGGPPVVFVDSPRAPDPGVDFDLEGAQFEVTRHLIEHGHERIGYLSPPLHVPNVALKFRGFERALTTADLQVDPELVVEVPDFEIRSGQAAADRLLEMTNPPIAMAAASDYLALGAYHAITSRGLAIPDDVALVGNDDIEMAAIVRPALTTVSLPVEEAGTLAVAMLEDLIAGVQPEPSRVILDTELVVRETCGCSATPSTHAPRSTG